MRTREEIRKELELEIQDIARNYITCDEDKEDELLKVLDHATDALIQVECLNYAAKLLGVHSEVS